MNTTQRTTSKIVQAAFAAALFLTVIGLQGCTPDSAVFGDGTQQEVVSPTGCLKSQGRYYDPKLKQCVQVDDRQRLLELDAYRQVNQLAEEGKVSQGEYMIGFSNYIALNSAEELLAELRGKGATLMGVFGRLPSSVHGGCGWHHGFDSQPEEKTIRGMLLKSLETMEANPALSGTVPERRKAIFEDDLCRIDSMWLSVSPTAIRDFWNQHLDEIQGIRPQISDLDKAMPTFGPLQPFPEGE